MDTSTNGVVSEVPVGGFDPTPVVIKTGRGFLYDARLSGNGTVSCASCHLDGTNDRLAWDLGDPNGQMQNVVGPASLTGATTTFPMHPMKGPMTTQTLKGLKNMAPLHWRGDRAGFTAFNPAFASLLGGSQLSAADMDAFAQFVETMNLPPNPNQQLDRTLPASHAGGNPAAGMNTFLTEPYTSTITCNMCHKVDPGPGTDKTFTSGPVMQQPQTMKVPQLRTLYQKKSFTTTAGATSLDGFGLTHDGTDPGLFAFISRPVFTNFTNDTVRKNNIAAFLLCLDTGTAPAVGFTRTVTATNLNDAAVARDWALLQNQATVSNIDLIAKGTIDGAPRGLVYDRVSNSYLSDTTGVGPFTQADLQAKIAAGDTLSITGVPLGSGVRMGIDRDLDGRLDGDPLIAAALP